MEFIMGLLAGIIIGAVGVCLLALSIANKK